MSNRIFPIIFLAVLIFSNQAISQDWPVPEEQAELTNPVEYNLSNVKKGQELYIKNCKSCHGDPGKGNGLPLVPSPVDITSEKMQKNSPGELFYKISNGRGGMPQFSSALSEDDRWRLVSFINNYNPEYEPVLVEAPPVKAKLLASVNEEDKIVEVFAEYLNSDGDYVSLVEGSITIGAKKRFGNLIIGEASTGKNGRAEFAIPETLIGDEEGYVDLVVSVGDNYEAEDVLLEKAMVGKKKEVPRLIKKEILWSTNENVQTWLLLSYLGAAGAAWITIIYVIFQIIKIRRLNKE